MASSAIGLQETTSPRRPKLSPYGTDKLIWFEALLSTPFASTLFTS